MPIIMAFKELTENEKIYILENINSNTTKLLLSSDSKKFKDYNYIISNIESRKKLRNKFKEWAFNPNLIFPFPLSSEQCSSLQCALHKREYIKSGFVADLTGGLGVDSFAFSSVAESVLYVERDEGLFNSVKYNFNVLGLENVCLINAEIKAETIDSIIGKFLFLKGVSNLDLIYLDPSRRRDGGKRVLSLSEYEPDVIRLKTILLKYSPVLLFKLSPMCDLKAIVNEMGNVTQVDILSIDNECKEILVKVERNSNLTEDEIYIRAFNLTTNKENSFCFRMYEERESIPFITKDFSSEEYLYEPDVSIMKSGSFKLVSTYYNIKKLAINSHLYTSDKIVEGFNGRVFKIIEVADYKKSTIRNLRKIYPKANISVRNFHLSASDLRDSLKIQDGGDITIFGTTLSTGDKRLIICRKIG